RLLSTPTSRPASPADTTGRLTMCDRIGCMHLPNLKSMDFSRRNFLRTTAATTLTMAVGGGFMGPAHAASSIKSTHGTGFCNLNIFLSHAVQTAKDDGVELVFVHTPKFAHQVTTLGTCTV